MDTPSRKSASLVCRCGASLSVTDLVHRVNEAVEEFCRVHVTELCGVSEGGPLDTLLASWDRLTGIESLHGGVLAVCAEQVRQAMGRAKP